MQRRVRGACREGEVAAAAFGIEADRDGDRLDQRGLAAPVLAGKQRQPGVELEFGQSPDRGNRERIGIEVFDLVTHQHDGTDERIDHEAESRTTRRLLPAGQSEAFAPAWRCAWRRATGVRSQFRPLNLAARTRRA